ncbi:MAG: YihY/virulence factor BrkB family protein [Micrococcales bacterium]|nr:YihY/virulence factor BrkB family protein [Micrococcales bacterium]
MTASPDSPRDSSRSGTSAPDPEDDRKPDSPADMTKPSWGYVLKKTLREFSADQATDLAASLTYYAVLAVFPALLAFVSLLGLFGDPQRTTDALISLVGGLAPQQSLDALRGIIRNLTQSPGAGLALVIGVVGAVWSASGYVTAFSRAMNRIYEIPEGRPFWKLRPVMLLVTVAALVAAVVAAVVVALSGPVADRAGSALGLGDVAVGIWGVAKWLIIVVLAVAVLALLYWATPNVKQPKFRWTSIGSVVALVVWAIASVAFAVYAANFASYNATYGSIGGVIVFLLWIWISNNALLFGAELDAELERGRELQAGLTAEESIQLPPRDTRQSDKKAAQREKDVAAGRALRESRGADADPDRR